MRFSSPGDSGSCIFSEDGKFIGLLWGGLETTDGRFYTIAHKAKEVLDDLKLSLTKPNIIDEPNDDDEPNIDLQYQTKVVEFASEYLGIKEVKGKSHNPTIVGIINIACNELNLPISLANTDETAWCSLFAIYVALNAVKARDISRYKLLLKNQNINATARSWEKLDTGLNIANAKFGDIVVFRKANSTWRGHVGFYCSHDKDNVIVLGGNQSNSVSYSKYNISLLTAVIRLEDALKKYGTKDIRNEKMV